METAVAASAEAQEFVRELRLLSGNLRAEYEAEREAHPIAAHQHRAAPAGGRALEHFAPAGLGCDDCALRHPRRGRDRDDQARRFRGPEQRGQALRKPIRADLPPPGAEHVQSKVSSRLQAIALATIWRRNRLPPPPADGGSAKPPASRRASLHAARQRPASQRSPSAPAEMKLDELPARRCEGARFQHRALRQHRGKPIPRRGRVIRSRPSRSTSTPRPIRTSGALSRAARSRRRTRCGWRK